RHRPASGAGCDRLGCANRFHYRRHDRRGAGAAGRRFGGLPQADQHSPASPDHRDMAADMWCLMHESLATMSGWAVEKAIAGEPHLQDTRVISHQIWIVSYVLAGSAVSRFTQTPNRETAELCTHECQS